ncbi:MAG: BCCT family transporter, partial [Bacteroidales bacterium]|nr:BCCT family transporter [Bacteroidales bacterium]
MKVRPMTFFPPFIVLAAFVVISIISPDAFLGLINTINNWIIKNLGWAASLLALAIVLVTFVAMFSKFGDVRIGGEDAK